MNNTNTSTSTCLVSPSSLAGSRGALPNGRSTFSSLDDAATAKAVRAYAAPLDRVVTDQFTIMSEIGPAVGFNSVQDQLEAIVNAMSDADGWRSFVDAGAAAFAKERLLGIMSQCNAGIEGIKGAERDAKDESIAKLQDQVLRLEEENAELAAARDNAEALVKERHESLTVAETELKGYQNLVSKFVNEAGGVTQPASKRKKT